ncbi:FadR/GntR family transcriptional regulator [Halarsenatibacter silvermanii]|uniref:GntR family transcriptional regulator, transcriptional repressor for pyruvate dehydrogenase complex n=1 Tax=Halarsenatibacter silvermanii TaxID=321763 RepID=A0A1G9RHP6_9FIRM|nr:FadR/GntR family transcriptional regulator [Halarsenatibacter silvermanii]SDM22842.1 GntR family transcriptional regulator, transcriptional repressor for pyruvate dehydrogenase complex [Halarsenatibacter silvermanii]
MFEDETIEQSNMYEKIVERILDLLKEGELKPGDNLPSEKKLAQNFGVSRVTIRESLQVLELLGLIEKKKGASTEVISDRPIFKNIFSLSFDENTEETLLELYEIRILIEPEVVKRVAARELSDKKLADIEKALKKMKSQIEKGEAGRLEDITFHQAIIKAWGNNILTSFIISLIELQHKSRKITLTDRPEEAFRYHQEIYKAVVEGASEKASQAMKAHLKESMEVLQKRL